MGAIQPKGILFGLISFAVLYIGVTFLSNIIVRIEGPQITLLWLSSLTAFLTWVVSGYITGVFAKTRGTINGALFGLCSILVVSLTQYIFGGAAGLRNTFYGFGFYYWVSTGVLMGGLGGLLWDLYSKSKKNRL